MVLKAIAQGAGREPQSLVANLGGFRTAIRDLRHEHGAEETARRSRPYLVIIAIGENVPALTSEPAKAAFKTSLTKLLQKLKENSRPVILVRSCFWPDRAKDTYSGAGVRHRRRNLCGQQHAGGKDEANQARSEHQFSHAGVAAHPGDTGHAGHRRRHSGSTEQE